MWAAEEVILFRIHISLPGKFILSVIVKTANTVQFWLWAGTTLIVASSANDR